MEKDFSEVIAELEGLLENQIQNAIDPNVIMQEQAKLNEISEYLAAQIPNAMRQRVLQTFALRQDTTKNQRDDHKVELMSNFYLGKNVSNQKEELPPIGIWEYVIVLPNPDYPDPKGRSFITKEEATNIFDNCFQGAEANSIDKQKLNKILERQAFRTALDKLPCVSGVDDNKRYREGGRLVKNEKGQYVDCYEAADDFVTMIRNIILLKLSYHLGFETSMMISSSGQYIYIVLYPSEQILANEAERIRFNIQLDVAMTDFSSMEPCDNKLRPFRLIDPPNEEIRKLQNDLAEFYHNILSDEYKQVINQTTVRISSSQIPDEQ